jgi:hypothetical protein
VPLLELRKRKSDHPDSWIFGPKYSVKEAVEKRPPFTRIGIVVAVVLMASAVSAVALTSGGGGGPSIDAGVPEGTVLTASSAIRVTRDGTTIDALDVDGQIYVRADDVTITNTRVRTGSGHAIRLASGYTGLTVTDSTLECTTDAGRSGVAWNNYTADNVLVSEDCRRGFVAGANATITDSYWGTEPFADVVGRGSASPSTTLPRDSSSWTQPATPTTVAPPTTAAPGPTTTAPPAEAPAPPAPSRPSDTGFPTAESTGVPAGVSLRSSGGQTVTRDGTVIDGLDVRGNIIIEASNVTIRNTRVTVSSGTGIQIRDGSATIEDTEIVGTGPGCDQGIAYGHYVARRVEVHGCLDGMKANGDVQVYDSLIYNLRDADGSHNDGIQSTGGSNMTFEGNTICAQYQNSVGAIKLTAENQPINDLVIRNNYLYGGNYTIYMDSKPGMEGVITDALVENNITAAGSFKHGEMTRDSHPTQRLVNNVVANPMQALGWDPCSGSTT